MDRFNGLQDLSCARFLRFQEQEEVGIERCPLMENLAWVPSSSEMISSDMQNESKMISIIYLTSFDTQTGFSLENRVNPAG